MKSSMTAAEFRAMISNGTIEQRGKKLVQNELLPEYSALLNRKEGIFIPGEVYSSKNNKQIIAKWTKHSKWMLSYFDKYTKKSILRPVQPFITDSDVVNKYKKEKISLYIQQRDNFLKLKGDKPYPLFITFQFIRKNKSGWDFNNMTELVQDMMVLAKWIPDDSVKYMYPVPLPYLIDKKNPGIIINIQ